MIYIQAGGKKRPINAGSWMIRQFCEANKLSLTDFLNIEQQQKLLSTSPELALNLVYFCFLDGCRIAKVEPDFAEADIYDWVDENPEIMGEAINNYAKSITRDTTEKPTKKKKVSR